jgi:hypothetical protein
LLGTATVGDTQSVKCGFNVFLSSSYLFMNILTTPYLYKFAQIYFIILLIHLQGIVTSSGYLSFSKGFKLNLTAVF